MCERHGLEFVGSVCGEGFCVECSREFQESMKGPVPLKQKHPGRGFVMAEVKGSLNGRKVWVVDGVEC